MSDEFMTTKELAEVANVSVQTINRVSGEIFSNKNQQGKETHYSEREARLVLDGIKHPAAKPLLKKITEDGPHQLNEQKASTAIIAEKEEPDQRPLAHGREQVNSSASEVSVALSVTDTSIKEAEIEIDKATKLVEEANARLHSLLKEQILRLTEKEKVLQIELDQSKEWSTLQKWCAENEYDFDRKTLAKFSLRMGRLGYQRKKIYSAEYKNGLWSYRNEDIKIFIDKEIENGI